MAVIVGCYFLGLSPAVNGSPAVNSSKVNGQFVPPIFDPVDPIDMQRITSGNYSFIPFKMGVMATPIMCTTPGDIIKGAVSMASHNATAGNNTIQAIKGLATAQVGIDKNMTGNALQKAMNLIVCMPAPMKQMSKTQQNMTGSMKDGMLMK
ncbi:MAG TPA: hypothetical protein VIR31_04040 [Nitrososphaeraceae archaeon]